MTTTTPRREPSPPASRRRRRKSFVPPRPAARLSPPARTSARTCTRTARGGRPRGAFETERCRRTPARSSSRPRRLSGRSSRRRRSGGGARSIVEPFRARAIAGLLARRALASPRGVGGRATRSRPRRAGTWRPTMFASASVWGRREEGGGVRTDADVAARRDAFMGISKTDVDAPSSSSRDGSARRRASTRERRGGRGEGGARTDTTTTAAARGG